MTPTRHTLARFPILRPQQGPFLGFPWWVRRRSFHLWLGMSDLIGFPVSGRSGERAGDRIQKRIFDRIEAWLTASEISAVVNWSNNTLAHAADRPTNLSSAAPTFEIIAAAQRDIVRAAVALSTYILHGPVLGEIVPVLQYNQFHRFDRVVSDPAVQKMAAQRWFDLADERNRWGCDVFDALVA
jgi:hypothetical protein